MSVVIIETTADKVSEEAAKACESHAHGLGEWVRDEAAWALGTFLRAAISIAATRIVWGFVFSDPRMKLIYEKADALLAYGKQDRPYQRPPGGFGSSYGSPGGSPGGGATARDDPFDFGRHDYSKTNSQGAEVPEGAVYKKMVGEFAIYHHRTRHPQQEWPCPVLYKHPCETCTFYVADRSGRVWCAANEKLKMILAGADDNQDLYELRDYIKTMV